MQSTKLIIPRNVRPVLLIGFLSLAGVGSIIALYFADPAILTKRYGWRHGPATVAFVFSGSLLGLIASFYTLCFRRSIASADERGLHLYPPLKRSRFTPWKEIRSIALVQGTLGHPIGVEIKDHADKAVVIYSGDTKLPIESVFEQLTAIRSRHSL